MKALLKVLSLVNRDFETVTLRIIKFVNTRSSKLKRLNVKEIENIIEQEEILNGFISAYSYHLLVYERVMKKMRLYEDDEDLAEDLMIEIHQGLDICKSTLKTISNMRARYEIYLSNRLNKTITILTIFTVFMSIPSTISAIYGMNVALPFQTDPSAFTYVISIAVLIWIVMFFYFKRNDLI